MLADASRSGGTDPGGPLHVHERGSGTPARCGPCDWVTRHARSMVLCTAVDLTITLALPERLTSVRVETRRNVPVRDVDAGDDMT